MKNLTEEETKFLNKLAEVSSGPREVTVFSRFYSDIENCSDPGPLTEILSLNESLLSENAKMILNLIEKNEDEAVKDKWVKFKWKVLAFTVVQDVFDFQIYESELIDIGNKQWYFYFEAKYILTELILSALNGFEIGYNQSLRLFIEFNALQGYLNQAKIKQKSWKPIDQYFRNKFNPKWSTIISGCTPNDEFSKAIKKRLQVHLTSISEKASHPYQPMFSPKAYGLTSPGHNMESMYFFYTASLILDSVLWIYFVNFPMLLCPVDVTKKFGFNVLIGIYVDPNVGGIIKKSLSEKDYAIFRSYAEKTEDFKNYMAHYESLPDMSEKNILETWSDKNQPRPSNVGAGTLMTQVQIRGMREAMSFSFEQSEEDDGESKWELFEFHKWKKIYHKIK